MTAQRSMHGTAQRSLFVWQRLRCKWLPAHCVDLPDATQRQTAGTGALPRGLSSVEQSTSRRAALDIFLFTGGYFKLEERSSSYVQKRLLGCCWFLQGFRAP